MATESDQSKVAYEVAPKEVTTHNRMPSSARQFGKLSKTMPQDQSVTKGNQLRYKEHR